MNTEHDRLVIAWSWIVGLLILLVITQAVLA